MKAPPSELELIESSNRFKYNNFYEIFDFLNIPPVISSENINRIEEMEKRLGIELPESVREWFSLFAAREILESFSCVIVYEFDNWEIENNIIRFMDIDDQYNWFHGFTILEKEDPQVYNWFEGDKIDSSGHEIWIETEETFSYFIHRWIVVRIFQMVEESNDFLDDYEYHSITLNTNEMQKNFKGCIKPHFKNIIIDEQNYYYSSSLELFASLRSSNQCEFYYKSEDVFVEWLKKVFNCMGLEML